MTTFVKGLVTPLTRSRALAISAFTCTAAILGGNTDAKR